MALSLNGRALHFVLRVADRGATAHFFRSILGMQTLRHEEFSEGCEATCNGPYDNRWSKTMVAYGPEDDNFAVELTYNYGVKSYRLGNDILGITIKSSEAIERAKQFEYKITETPCNFLLQAPGGYNFFLINEPQPQDSDPIIKVTLACSNLENTIRYWNGILGLQIINQTDKAVELAFDANQCLLEFEVIKEPIDHAETFGRIAFSVPTVFLPDIQSRMEAEGQKILTPLTDLETPEKATVTVIILADPDGHEICFVGDENFRELSKVESNADAELDKYIKRDRS